jgi:hypothetical protein
VAVNYFVRIENKIIIIYLIPKQLNVTLGFRREVRENCALLCYQAESIGNLSPTFRDNLSVRNYHYSLRDSTDERSAQLNKFVLGYNFISLSQL